MCDVKVAVCHLIISKRTCDTTKQYIFITQMESVEWVANTIQINATLTGGCCRPQIRRGYFI